MLDVIEIPVADVIVRDRIRKDLGDTSGLMISMEKVGQLQPIGITSGNVLVFGARRLDAAQRANWETILAVRLDNLTDALKLAQAERDENEERKPFTPSEAVAAGKAIEAIEKPKAQQRKASGKNQHSEPASKLDEGSTGRTDEKVSAAVGMSKSTYRKAKTVVEAAEKPDAPPEVKAAAVEMDRTGKVDPAFQAVKAATEQPKPAPVDPVAAKRSSILDTLAPLEREIRHLADLDPAVDRAKAIESLGKLIAAVKGKSRRVAASAKDETDRHVEAIYAAYPRRVGKGQAVRAITAALKIATYDVLLEAVEEYATAKAGEDPQFIPHPATWFNGRRWEDDRADWRVRGGPKPLDKLAALDDWTPEPERLPANVIEIPARRIHDCTDDKLPH